MKQHSERFLKKRKFMLALPVLIVPFLTMGFWAAGGGKGKQKTVLLAKQGLNTKLPDARLKDDHSLNKLSFYELAQKDSQKLKIAIENDRYHMNVQGDSDKYNLSQIKTMAENFSNRYHQLGLTRDNGLNQSPDYSNKPQSAEENLLQKLNQLETEINKPVNEKQRLSKYTHRSSKEGVDENFSSNVNRLENMAQLMNDKGEGDPEIKKLDTVLEKILDIQHPERIKEKIKDKAGQNKKEVLPVKRDENLPTVSLFGNDDSMNQNLNENRAAGFYGLNDNSDFASTSQNAVDAVIHETQTLVSGSVVKLRLLSSISINGNLISKDNFVFGIAKLNGERLQIEISSITSDNSIYPVSLEVYDLDGLPGIYIPGAITRDVAKQSANNSLQSMGFSTLDPSLTVQATTAGINAAKDLISKKIKMVRVTVKEGYKVLLKING